MKKITCEICGSNDVIKKDDFFECQICGTKYSTDEVKKIVLEGSIDISGSTVKIDNSENIRNYLNLANYAFETEHYSECEFYCNKILEIDSTNYETWFLKGKSVSMQELIEETLICFSNALNNSPEDKIDEMKSRIAEETQLIIVATIIYKCQHFLTLPKDENSFLKYPSDDDKRGIVEIEKIIIENFKELLLECGFNDSELRHRVCIAIQCWAMMQWLDKIEPEYSNIKGYPTWVEWQRFFARADAVVYLVESSTLLLKEKTIDFTAEYKFLISVYEYILDEEDRIVKATERNLLSLKLSRWRFDKIMEWHRKWNEIDPTHIIPTNKLEKDDEKRNVTDESKEIIHNYSNKYNKLSNNLFKVIIYFILACVIFHFLFH